MALSWLQMKSSKALGRYLFAHINSISFTFSLLSFSFVTLSGGGGAVVAGAVAGAVVGVGPVAGGILSLNGFSLTKKALFLICFLFSIISFEGDRPCAVVVMMLSLLLKQEPSPPRILAMKVENEVDEVAELLAWLLRSGLDFV